MSVYLTKKTTLGQAVFNLFAYTMLGLMALTSLLPFIYLLSLSLSSNIAVQAGKVGLLPVGFTLENYGYIAKEASYFRAFWVSVERVALGASLNMLMAILVAYPLSKPSTRFTSRKYYAWFFAFTMFFSGGMIPTYLVVRYTGLTDTIWALVIPGAVNVWNTIMLMRFFTEVPPELEEAAIVDGAGHASIIFNVYLPLSLPALATILLLVTVGHWNEWFSAVLY
ncbi:MAG: carbohydrate ABC transporter permease, partial [Clostridia bacterium]